MAGAHASAADRRELRRLLTPRPQFSVSFSKAQVTASLWDYAEDALATRALTMTDADLLNVQRICAWYEDPSYPLPVVGQRITHNHVTALAAITYFEGHLRPLAQNRRRPSKDRPPQFSPSPPDAATNP